MVDKNQICEKVDAISEQYFLFFLIFNFFFNFKSDF